jgi:hypothetical protein
VVEEILPLYSIRFLVGHHRLNQLSQLRRDADGVLANVDALLEKLRLIKMVVVFLKRKFLIDHPVKSETKGINIAFVGVGLFEDELWS